MSRMKEIRERRGLSQKEVAAKLEMPVRTYGGYERGERTLSLDVAAQIADVLDVTLDYLLGRQIPKKETLRKEVAEEAELVELFRRMQPEHRTLLLDNARAFAALSEKDGHNDGQHIVVGTVDAVV